MIDNRTIARIEAAIPKRDIQALQEITIFQDENGSYNLFNKYVITKVKQDFVVTLEQSFTTETFFQLKNAVAWCTLDTRDKILEADRVIYLDRKLASLEASIALLNNLVRKTKSPDDKLIYLAKLSEDKAQKRKISSELEYFLNESKRWQTQRFNRKPAH